MKHYVYKITDPETGQYYYGSRTHKDPENDNYMGSMVSWKPEDKSRLFKIIIKDDFKAREEAIQFESRIIEENIDNELNENYNIPNKGFHTTGLDRDDKWKDKISKNNGRYWLGKTRPKHSNRMKGEQNPFYGNSLSGNKNGMYGRVHREDSKKKMRENRPDYTGINNPNYGKSSANRKHVLQYDKDKNFIKEWKSILSAAKALNISNGSISEVCNNKRKSAGGYIWKFSFDIGK